jgi:deoxyribonuclease V
MEPARPDLAPEPGLSRPQMEALQWDVAAAATFEDDVDFDPAALSLSEQDSLAGERRTVAGVDQAFLDDRAVSAIVAMRGGEVVERVHAVSELTIPYIPGLLSFREGGPILDAFRKLSVEPDLVLFDGSGRIHFRQAGLATHMGVVLDVPSVGVAKSLLCGRPREDPGGRPEGWRTPVVAGGGVEPRPGVDGDDFTETVVGYAFQSRQYDSDPVVNPLYVSPGHRFSAETAVTVVERLCDRYKLPEPTRRADKYADEAKAEHR